MDDSLVAGEHLDGGQVLVFIQTGGENEAAVSITASGRLGFLRHPEDVVWIPELPLARFRQRLGEIGWVSLRASGFRPNEYGLPFFFGKAEIVPELPVTSHRLPRRHVAILNGMLDIVDEFLNFGVIRKGK